MMFGGRDDDLIECGDGDDWAFGNFDRDSIQGGVGSDVIFGGQHEDQLDGGEGDDWLIGDRDADTLTGGAGVDTFVLKRDLDDENDNDGNFDNINDDDFDIITDFQAGVDQLGLTADLPITALSWADGSGINAGQTVIRYVPTGEAIAVLNQFSAANLTEANFTQWSL
jgi:Ca2+-binding RTX toxin-like protein